MNEALKSPLFEDLSDLEASLVADTGGDQARALIAYFERNRVQAQALLASPIPLEERQLIGRLTEGLGAAQRIVTRVWEGVHAAPLALH